MKLITAGLAVAFLCAIGTPSQSQTTKTKETTKVDIKGGKEITVSGCLDETSSGSYMLRNRSGGREYSLVTDDNLKKYVGHRVEIKGKASDLGEAKVKVESKTKTDVENGPDSESRSTTEMKGDLKGTPMLGVKSIKSLAESCE
jgi:hypothetical protein